MAKSYSEILLKYSKEQLALMVVELHKRDQRWFNTVFSECSREEAKEIYRKVNQAKGE